MPRLPLIVTGLVLLLAAVLAFVLSGTPAQPQVRMRSDTGRTEPRAPGIDAATAPIREPSRVVRTVIEPDPKSPAAADGSSAPPAVPQPTWVGARLVREGKPLAGLDLALVPEGGGRRQNVRTDQNGRFRRVLPAAGNWTLRAEADDLSVHQTEWTVRVEDGRPFDLGDLVVRPRVRLSGRALRPDGSPLAGAVVRGTAGDGELKLPELRTGDDGAFAWLDVPPGAVALTASTDTEYGRAIAAIDDARAEVHAPLAMRTRATIRWTLRDDDGRPVAGAAVGPADSEWSLDPTATTDELGHVELETAVGARLRIACDGYVPAVATVDASADERRVAMLRLRELRGTLGAAGKGAIVRIGLAAGAADSASAEVLLREHRAADDGTFAIPGLVAGRYTVRAFGEGLAAQLREVALPGDELVSLEPVAGRVRQLRVRDERGMPVPFARVQAGGREWLADRDGAVAVAVPGDEFVEVAVSLPGHLPATAQPGEGAEAVVLLPRAARLDGRVVGYRNDLPYALRALAWQERDGQRRAVELSLDQEGRFDLADREPGPWVVTIERRDRTRAGGTDAALPLLFDGIDSRATTRVFATGGERTAVLLPLPEVVTVRGRVLQGGRPVAGATVFAVPHGEAPPAPLDRDPLGFDHVAAARRCARTRSDADGNFVVLVAQPGRFDVRARLADQPFASAPLEVAVRSYGDEPLADLELPLGAVSGRFTTAAAKDPVRAWLLPTADAARDPFRAPAGDQPDAQGRQSVGLGAGGAFAFHAVPAGLYVLRFTRGDRVLRQRTVRVDAGPVEIGALQPAPTTRAVSLPLAAKAPAGSTVELLAVMPECLGGAFAARATATDSVLLQDLPAGRYRLVVKKPDGELHAEEVVDLRGDGSTARPPLANLR